jgi:hypothetical protein
MAMARYRRSELTTGVLEQEAVFTLPRRELAAIIYFLHPTTNAHFY